jgi:hypothetical protein
MAKGVAKNSDGLMVKSFDISNDKVEFTTDVKEAYNYGCLGTMEANNELDFLKHHMGKEHVELQTMEYVVVPT